MISLINAQYSISTGRSSRGFESLVTRKGVEEHSGVGGDAHKEQ